MVTRYSDLILKNKDETFVRNEEKYRSPYNEGNWMDPRSYSRSPVVGERCQPGIGGSERLMRA